jgi:predicted transcriptional regulator
MHVTAVHIEDSIWAAIEEYAARMKCSKRYVIESALGNYLNVQSTTRYQWLPCPTPKNEQEADTE